MLMVQWLSASAYTREQTQDGSVAIVDDSQLAFIWTEEFGMVSIYNFLLELGIEDVEGWVLTNATGISDDGLTIVGIRI